MRPQTTLENSTQIPARPPVSLWDRLRDVLAMAGEAARQVG